jgi:uncharacterized iron-regulated protein
MNKTRPLFLMLALLWVSPLALTQAVPAAPATDDAGSALPYPPAQEPKPGEIFHVPTGLAMTFDGMMDMVSGARLVYVGETHDNLHAHQVQLQVIRDLHRRFPGRIAIGMEMFRQPQQQVLDRWTRGQLSELEFLQGTQWLKTWSFDFGYYKAILDFAREQQVDVIALNPAAELQAAVRQNGLDALPEAVRSQLPEIGEPDPYQREVMKAIYGGHLPTEGAFESFFRVQLLWEESMATTVVDYLRSPRGTGKIVVMLTGAGHVEYGFGVPKKVLRRMPLPYVIIAPTEIEIPPEKQMLNVKLPEIPLLPADFIWWVPYQDLEADKVRLGVGIDDRGNRLIVQSIAPDSPAARAGILVGDEITSIAGHPVADVTAVVYWVSRQARGAAVTATVRRDGTPLDIRVEF